MSYYRMSDFIWETYNYSILPVRPEPPKSAGTHRNVLPLVNVPFYARDLGFRVVQLRTVFVHFAAL